MEHSSPLLNKSYAFAVRIAKFCMRIQRTQKEYVLTKQLLKSGTSIGANIEEGTQAQSLKDFISKFSISLKESHETRFWLRLFSDVELAPGSEVESLLSELQEIIRMLVASLKTAKSKASLSTVH